MYTRVLAKLGIDLRLLGILESEKGPRIVNFRETLVGFGVQKGIFCSRHSVSVMSSTDDSYYIYAD